MEEIIFSKVEAEGIYRRLSQLRTLIRYHFGNKEFSLQELKEKIRRKFPKQYIKEFFNILKSTGEILILKNNKYVAFRICTCCNNYY